jgi:hypothetical protein
VTHPSNDATVGTLYGDVVKDHGLSNFTEHLSEVGQVRLKVLDMQNVVIGGRFWKLDCDVEPQVVMMRVSSFARRLTGVEVKLTHRTYRHVRRCRYHSPRHHA